MMSVLAGWTLAVLTAGWIGGQRFERARRGWYDLRVTKAQVPVLRAAARLLSTKAVGAMLLAAAVAAFSIYTFVSEAPQ